MAGETFHERYSIYSRNFFASDRSIVSFDSKIWDRNGVNVETKINHIIIFPKLLEKYGFLILYIQRVSRID